MSNINIRRAYVDDMHIVSYVMSKSWQMAYSDIIPPDVMEESIDINCHWAMFRSILSEESQNIFICEYNGSPVGIIAYNHQCGNVYEILLLYTLPEVWGTDCGDALMNTVLDILRNSGAEYLYLWVFTENLRAQRFYEKYGFTTDNTERSSQFGTTQIKYTLKLK